MHVIGTAGHVDHGKSTLIKALTGIDPDRLPQEKERGMTIDLGFAWLTLPSGREVSIVDVPGHDRFIRNMLAGIGGIDLGLLVVAADEGVMPQTREHLAILDILQIKRALVAMTKSDLVDHDLLELAEAETKEALQGTVFQGAPVVPVSAYTGHGLTDLQSHLDEMLSYTPVRQDLGRPRLPIDRSFTVAGFGTIVTGTLIDGNLKVGQEVDLVPSGRSCRIRGLESHHRKIDTAEPGRRLAVNVSGIRHDEIQRGELLTTRGWIKPTSMIDAKIKLIATAARPLKHNARVTFHLLVSETEARVRLLDSRQLEPGQEAWAQIHLASPVPLAKGDFFVMRSPEATLGGGQVVDAHPRRHRPFLAPVLERLAVMENGRPDDLVLTALDNYGWCDLANLSQQSNLPLSEVKQTIAELSRDGRLLLLGNDQERPDSVVYSNRAWQELARKANASLVEYHGQYPLRRGIPKEELRSRLGLSPSLFTRVLARFVVDGIASEEGVLVRLAHHETDISTEQQQETEAYLKSLQTDPFSPSTKKPLNPELLALLIDEGVVVKVDGSIVFSAKAYKEMVDRITTYITEHGHITVAEARSLFDSTRKYMLPLLEYMDQQRITKRVGDERVLR